MRIDPVRVCVRARARYTSRCIEKLLPGFEDEAAFAKALLARSCRRPPGDRSRLPPAASRMRGLRHTGARRRLPLMT